MLKRGTVALFCLCALSVSAVAADNQQKFWTDYIESCYPDSQLNGKARFLGAANPIGPGSVWGTAGGTANLVAGEEKYLGKADDKGHYPVVTYARNTVECSAKGARKWDFTLGAPINILSAGNLNLTVALKNSQQAEVKIDAVKVDSIGIAEWSDAAGKIDRNSQVFLQAVDGRHYLMTAALAISGMTITYTLDDSITAQVKGWFHAGQKVQVGSSDNPIEAGLDISTDGKKATVTIPASNPAYVLGELRPIKKMKEKDVFATKTDINGNTVPKVSGPIVNGGVPGPQHSAN